jgi:hypothetical protein
MRLCFVIGKKKLFRRQLPCLISILAVAGCSTESRHRTIIYDESWSSAAAVRNLSCAPDLQKSCEQEARDEESSFSKKLSAAFRASPKCRTVGLIVLVPGASDAKDVEDRLERNVGSQYWRLRVDFHPRLPTQTFDLGPGTDRPRIGGDDAEHNTAYICEAAKNNGVTAIW